MVTESVTEDGTVTMTAMITTGVASSNTTNLITAAATHASSVSADTADTTAVADATVSTAAPAKRVYPDRIIIETSGSAFPTPLVHEIDRVAKSTHIIIDFAAYMRFMRKFHIFVDYLDNLYYSWLSIVYTTIINDFYLIQHLTLFSLIATV